MFCTRSDGSSHAFAPLLAKFAEIAETIPWGMLQFRCSGAVVGSLETQKHQHVAQYGTAI